jgi:hypothetical protein
MGSTSNRRIYIYGYSKFSRLELIFICFFIRFYSIGFYDEHLSCWRPRGNSIFNELRRFFIGGSTELEDISYVAIPKLFDSEKVTCHLNKKRDHDC